MSYHGESFCTAAKKSGVTCANKAYYQPQLCGVHCRKADRVLLPINPLRDENRQQELFLHSFSIEQASVINRENSRPGEMRMERMRKSVPLTPGFLNVFPNYRAGGISGLQGRGVPSLSPMVLGPVFHEELGTPPASNLENYFQFSKVFPCETELGQPTEEFYSRRVAGFLSTIPQRHKFS